MASWTQVATLSGLVRAFATLAKPWMWWSLLGEVPREVSAMSGLLSVRLELQGCFAARLTFEARRPPDSGSENAESRPGGRLSFARPFRSSDVLSCSLTPS